MRKPKLLIVILVLALGATILALTLTRTPSGPADRFIRAVFPEGRDVFGRNPDDYVATGANAMVVSEGEPATRIAIDVLREGGNAVDAAIALSFAISVHRPFSTGLGGGGFMVIHDGPTGKSTIIDMRETAPAAATRDMYLRDGEAVIEASRWGGLAVATPGLVAGLHEAHRSHGSGKLGWRRLVEPSVALARDGFPIDPDLADAIQWVVDKGLLARFPRVKALLTGPDGGPLKKGEIYRNGDLAKTLEEIAAKGPAGFYEGWVAEELVRAVRADGGILSLGDLKSYRPRVREPIRGAFHGYEIISMPPPSSGGVHVIQMLNILERFENSVGKADYFNPESLHVKAEIMRRAFADRAKYLGDPDFVKVPTEGIVSKEYATTLAATIHPDRASRSGEEIEAGDPAPFEKPNTTHFSIVDSSGTAVASTQTINYVFGAVLVGGKTGVFLNDEMDDFSVKPGVANLFGLVGGEANAIAPNKRPLSSMTPTVVTREGKTEMVLGSPGGSKIITAVWNVIVNHLLHGMSLRDAVFAPRIHHQWLPDELVMEANGFPGEVVKSLGNKGHRIAAKSDFDLGNVTALVRAESGWIGVGDPRRGSAAAGY